MARTDRPSHNISQQAVEPIAIVGIGCRFAGGVNSPDSFWELLLRRQEVIDEIPADRWSPYADANPDYSGVVQRATKRGGFLADISGFDAEFFGLSPREAEIMDPQQRILLEVVWEALEHAGIPPHDLAGTDTGVIVGVGSDDYGRRLLEDLPRIEAWTGIGAAFCAAANRISYALDLRGPSLAVDTACSASLVAVHLACQSLRFGESTLALAGGVNLIVSPGLTVSFDRAGVMAPDGRCKSFDAEADGYGRAEGCGVLVLKRLEDAGRAGDRVLALIRGSAVNQDGRTNGIMAPNGMAQEYLLRQACRNAGVSPTSIDYVEAHGTGTRLGDPLEAGALSAVFGADRPPDQPCLIGSVKSNIGHLEAGAGIAGVIKAALALVHAEIPPNLNFSTPNPLIPWERSGLRVVTEPTSWPHLDHPRRAGVSSFGYGGTIAHVVLEQAPEAPALPRDPVSLPLPRVFPLSGASDAALRENAGRLADWLDREGPNVGLRSVGHTLAHRRSHLDRRATVVAADRDELMSKLYRLAVGETVDGVAHGAVLPDGVRGVVLVFSGHGSQWSGMGRELLETEPSFASTIDELEPIFREEIGFTPRQALVEGGLQEVDRIQPMIYATQMGLAAVWRSYGIHPSAVIGHSVGEIAAAVAAGVFDPESGARLVCRRSRLLRRAAGKGAMALVSLSFDDVRDRLADRRDAVPAIAASPGSTVIAGEVSAVEKLAEQWEHEGLLVRRVASDVAFHSPHMDPLLAELAAAVRDLTPSSPQITMYTTALDEPRIQTVHDGAYWAANLRNPVRFAAAVAAAAQDGYRMFVEVSAHPVVTHSVAEALAATGVTDPIVVPTLRRNSPEQATLLENLGCLHCRGAAVDWGRLAPDGELVTLPLIAWQRRPYWLETQIGHSVRNGQHDNDSHTLLGSPVTVGGTNPLTLWRTSLDESSRPYPGSHSIYGAEIVPAAVVLNTFLGTANGHERPLALTDVSFHLPLAVTSSVQEVQVLAQDGLLRLTSRSLDAQEASQSDRSWLTHATATGVRDASSLPESLDAVPNGLGQELDPDSIFDHLAAVGVPTAGFTWSVERLARRKNALRAWVTIEEHADGVPATWAPVLDAALSIAPVAFPGSPALRMVVGVSEAQLVGEPPNSIVIDFGLIDPESRCDTVDVLVADTGGSVVARLAGLHYAGMADENLALGATTTPPAHLVHRVHWRPLVLGPVAAGAADAVQSLVFVGNDTVTARALIERLPPDVRCLSVGGPEQLIALRDQLTSPGAVLVLPLAPGDEETLGETAARSAWLLASTAQRLVGWGTGPTPRLWCVTCGVRESADEASLAQAPLWGLGRVIASEHPEIWGGIVDLDPDQPAVMADSLLRIMRAQPNEAVMALRDGEEAVARLTRLDADPTRPPLRCRPEGTYLITGGLGSLGLEVARWLVGRGARRLILANRRLFPHRRSWDDLTDETTRRQVDAVRALEALGVTVRVVSLDIADWDQAATLLAPDTLGLPPIRGVVHAAGVLDNRVLDELNEASLRKVMRPKVEGALVLHELFPPDSLDFLVLFSSCDLLFGLTGQASYAAANAFLDGLARHRRAAGHDDTTSFGWSSWRDVRMGTNASVDAELRARGVGDISIGEAFRAWEYAAQRDVGYLAVLPTVGLEAGTQRPPLLSELPEDAPGVAAVIANGDAEFSWNLPPQERHERLVDEISRQVATEMKLSVSELDPHRPLVELGLDSVMALIIRNRLEQRLRISLPVTLLWHRPTVAAVADFMAEQRPT